eukprot:6214629-Amphidinium_carterae.3
MSAPKPCTNKLRLPMHVSHDMPLCSLQFMHMLLDAAAGLESTQVSSCHSNCHSRATQTAPYLWTQ